MTKRDQWAGRRIYVVGGSMGIGRAAARAFLTRGADLVLFARRPEPLAATADELREAFRERAVDARPLDATDSHATQAVMKDVVASVGPPDLLLNCAGRARPGYFAEIQPAQLLESLELNLLTAWNTCQALAPVLIERKGTIVNTGSVAGLVGVFGYTDYCASKFAVTGFSEALRQELAPHGVDVHVLCPPDTDTPGLAEENSTKPRETRAISESGGLLGADAVAEALLAGLARGRFLIVPGGEARLTVLAQRLAPGLVRRFMDRTVLKSR